MKKLSVYIHVPFCVRKCYYCDFLSAPANAQTKKNYVDRLLTEIEQEAENYRDFQVVSVFFGGGTPSILETKDTARIMSTIKACFCVSTDAEITSEINPGTADEEKLKEYKKMGFNRLSIGLQSTEEEELKKLGRIHDYRDFLVVYEAARKAGFENINVDVMAALPGQSVESYKRTLERVLSLSPEHISAYSLIVEEGTPFFEWYGEKGNPGLLPEEETEREMYEVTEQILGGKGYHRYEISNYAKEGFECRHNTAYWVRQDYVGFGTGAASLIGRERFQNKRNLSEYLEGDFTKEERQILTKEECMEEFMFLGLRLVRGVSKGEFFANFGVSLEQVYGKVLEKTEQMGLLVNGKERVFLTKKGLDVSNFVMAEFLL